MEKDRTIKYVAVFALLLSVLGLSLGFAAFSNSLTISSEAHVTPDASQFNVDFSTESNKVTVAAVEPALTNGATATNATINNEGDPTITGLNATFKQPGDKVVYSFNAYNDGALDAFLTSVTFNNASTGDSFKVCKAGEGTTESLVAAVCPNITATVEVGGTSYADTQTGITGHNLAKKTGETVVVTLEYTGNLVADGNFDVSFGDVVLKYDSVDTVTP